MPLVNIDIEDNEPIDKFDILLEKIDRLSTDWIQQQQGIVAQWERMGKRMEWQLDADFPETKTKIIRIIKDAAEEIQRVQDYQYKKDLSRSPNIFKLAKLSLGIIVVICVGIIGLGLFDANSRHLGLPPIDEEVPSEVGCLKVTF